MKTSNKILIGLLILIISIPFIATAIFKYKIAHGQSTANVIEPLKEIPHFIQKGNLANYKVIKIIGADTTADHYKRDLLTWTVVYNAEPQYYFSSKEETDSIKMHTHGDTLIFQYENKIENDDRYVPNYLKLTISIPKWVPIVIDRSRLILESQMDHQLMQNTESRTSIYLENHSQLQLGNTIYLTVLDSAKSSRGNKVFFGDTTSVQRQESIVMPANLWIQAHNSKVDFHNPLIFNNLTLNMAAGSTLSINHGFSVKKLSGQIDPNAKIESNAEAIPLLAPIIQK